METIKYNITLIVMWLCVFVAFVLVSIIELKTGFVFMSFIAMAAAIYTLFEAYEHINNTSAKGDIRCLTDGK